VFVRHDTRSYKIIKASKDTDKHVTTHKHPLPFWYAF